MICLILPTCQYLSLLQKPFSEIGGILGRGRSIRKAVRPCAVLAAPLSKWTHPINIQCKPYHSKVPLKILGMCHWNFVIAWHGLDVKAFHRLCAHQPTHKFDIPEFVNKHLNWSITGRYHTTKDPRVCEQTPQPINYEEVPHHQSTTSSLCVRVYFRGSGFWVFFRFFPFEWQAPFSCS